MRKRLAFEIHHARAQGFTPPFFTTENRTTAPAQATPVVAPTTTAAGVTRQATTSAAVVATQNNPTQDTKDADVPTTTTPATQVAAGANTNTNTNTPTTAIRTTAAVPTTPPVVVATTPPADANTIAAVNPSSNVQQLTVTRVTKTASQSASSSALPSASAAADDGPGVGSIAGYAAAALAGIAVISIFVIWMIRRKRRREEDADLDVAPFNRQSWLRNSTMIHDDVPTPGTTNFPPPRRDPEMIDRSFNATPVNNYASMNQYPQNNFGYATQPSYQPGAVIFSPSSANSTFGPGGGPATALPFSPGYDPTTPNPFEQQAGYTEVTRGGPPSPFNPYHQQQQFDDIQRQMTPAPHANLPAPVEEGLPAPAPRTPSPKIEAAPPVLPPIATGGAGGADTYGRVPAYPELSPAPTSAHGHVVEVRASTYEGQAAPVQYDFAEGPQFSGAVAPSTPVTIAAPHPPAALQPAAGRTLTRPETVYDTEDAYGGI